MNNYALALTQIISSGNSNFYKKLTIANAWILLSRSAEKIQSSLTTSISRMISERVVFRDAFTQAQVL